MVSGMEEPVGIQGDVRAMQAHSAGDIEISGIDELAELRKEFDHLRYRLCGSIHRVMEVTHAVFVTQGRQAFRLVFVPEVNDGSDAGFLERTPCVRLMP